MNSDVASRSVFLPSLSAPAGAALPLGSSACETRQKHTSRRSSEKGVELFREEVWKYWKKNGRHTLAWRKTRNPYHILVSEVMLQQTKVSRVEGKYREFLREFPTVRTLARAPLAEVLRVWSGLGYNRRAKFLHDAAQIIVEKYSGRVPHDYLALRTLPGIGDYTAKAVRVFAFNKSETLIETNIRTAYIHHFYSSVLQNTRIRDAQIISLGCAAMEGQNPREWHSALMDYGAYLKASGVRMNARSAHYTKQSKFEGSLRQVRGAILRELLSDSKGKRKDAMRRRLTAFDKDRFEKVFASLARDGLIGNSKCI